MGTGTLGGCSPRTWWEMLLPGSSGLPWLNPFVFATSGCHVAIVVHHGGIGAAPQNGLSSSPVLR